MEAVTSGTTVILNDHTFFTTEKTLDAFEFDLRESLFFQVHTNHLINMMHIERFVKCDVFITLSNFETIPVEGKNDNAIIKYLENKQML